MIDKFCILSIIFVVMLIGLIIVLLKKMKEGFGQYNLKVYGITLVVIVIAFLSIIPEPSNLAPAYGILGALAGYLFGLKSEKSD